MTEMYFILSWVGWIWLAVVAVLASVAVLVRYGRGRIEARRGFEVIGKNEKQS